MDRGGQQGSGPRKPRCEILSRKLQVTGLVLATPLKMTWGQLATPRRINAFHTYVTLHVMTFLPLFSSNSNGTQEQRRNVRNHIKKIFDVKPPSAKWFSSAGSQQVWCISPWSRKYQSTRGSWEGYHRQRLTSCEKSKFPIERSHLCGS
jgi:hypothetical protein